MAVTRYVPAGTFVQLTLIGLVLSVPIGTDVDLSSKQGIKFKVKSSTGTQLQLSLLEKATDGNERNAARVTTTASWVEVSLKFDAATFKEQWSGDTNGPGPAPNFAKINGFDFAPVTVDTDGKTLKQFDVWIDDIQFY